MIKNLLSICMLCFLACGFVTTNVAAQEVEVVCGEYEVETIAVCDESTGESGIIYVITGTPMTEVPEEIGVIAYSYSWPSAQVEAFIWGEDDPATEWVDSLYVQNILLSEEDENGETSIIGYLDTLTMSMREIIPTATDVIYNEDGTPTGLNAVENGFDSPNDDLTSDLLTGTVVWADDGDDTDDTDIHDACSALINGADLSGNISFVNRGACSFSDKVFRSQFAGAIACIIGNNREQSAEDPNAPVIMSYGSGETVDGIPVVESDLTIPSLFLGFNDAEDLRALCESGEEVTFALKRASETCDAIPEFATVVPACENICASLALVSATL